MTSKLFPVTVRLLPHWFTSDIELNSQESKGIGSGIGSGVKKNRIFESAVPPEPKTP